MGQDFLDRLYVFIADCLFFVFLSLFTVKLIHSYGQTVRVDKMFEQYNFKVNKVIWNWDQSYVINIILCMLYHRCISIILLHLCLAPVYDTDNNVRCREEVFFLFFFFGGGGYHRDDTRTLYTYDIQLMCMLWAVLVYLRFPSQSNDLPNSNHRN